ncbi:MAG: ABC transporter ATP-binding protein [Planctomycetota bacterium]
MTSLDPAPPSPEPASPDPTQSAGGPGIDARDVRRVFRGGLGWRARTALDGVDLTVARGRTLGLFGANGSGKTTLLRILAGVDRPTRGTVRVLGRAPTDREVRARVAYLPDASPFPEELSAPAVLDLVGALGGLRRRERRERAAALLERVGLADARRAPLRTFSRGMHRRFGFAHAFLTDPEVVLLDEPTAGLDAPGFDVLAELLSSARARGATIVLASHVASDLIDRCDELLLLRAGHVEQHGTPDELLGVEGELELRVRAGERTDAADLLAAGGLDVVEQRRARRPLVDLYRSTRGLLGSKDVEP